MGTLGQQVFTLLRLYWALEGRSRKTLAAVLLYVVVIVMLASYLFRSPDGDTWMALYWMILLFAAVNTGVLSYLQESGGRRWYYYQVAAPEAVFLAKGLHIFQLLLLVGLISGGMMGLLFGFPVGSWGMFAVTVLLTLIGLAMLFSFLAAISGQSRNAATLGTILSFPVVIGLALLAGKLSRGSLAIGLVFKDVRSDLLMLAGFDLLLAGMGLVLFAYIWRD